MRLSRRRGPSAQRVERVAADQVITQLSQRLQLRRRFAQQHTGLLVLRPGPLCYGCDRPEDDSARTTTLLGMCRLQVQALHTAVLRGVEVHLLVSKVADQFLVSRAQRSYYTELLQKGVHIHLFHEKLLHAKHMSIDGEVALIGSSKRPYDSRALSPSLVSDCSTVSIIAGVITSMRPTNTRTVCSGAGVTVSGRIASVRAGGTM